MQAYKFSSSAMSQSYFLISSSAFFFSASLKFNKCDILVYAFSASVGILLIPNTSVSPPWLSPSIKGIFINYLECIIYLCSQVHSKRLDALSLPPGVQSLEVHLQSDVGSHLKTLLPSLVSNLGRQRDQSCSVSHFVNLQMVEHATRHMNVLYKSILT